MVSAFCCCFSFQLYRLVFSLRHSKEERKDLDWEQEEKGRRARREAKERLRENNNSDAGKKERKSQRQMERTYTQRKVPTPLSSSQWLKRKKSLVSVAWLVGCVVVVAVAVAAPRPTRKIRLRNHRSCLTSARTRCGSTLWMLMFSL